ncbi:hypothetical protein BJ912DRAFT_904396 [Pholiota molesta]|nr:hypothetical protein BJ912DRAFT_904396 [Pholiota molesta]
MASGPGTQLFPNMLNGQIANLEITHVNGNVYYTTSEYREHLNFLRSKVSVAAFHNSCERSDALRCHRPDTRAQVQADIMQWLDDVDDPRQVTWIHGSAGVGKTAIAAAIATICYDSEPRRLAGAFFLSRSAPAESRRGDGKHLVATLAYQMADNIPDLAPHISKAIEKNRMIFDLDFETQIKELILDPLSALSAKTSNKIPPMLIVIDALDECSPIHCQARIIDALVKAMGKMQHKIPHKLLIASRPEAHITSAFKLAAETSLKTMVNDISLDPDESVHYDAGKDIRRFLYLLF